MSFSSFYNHRNLYGLKGHNLAQKRVQSRSSQISLYRNSLSFAYIQSWCLQTSLGLCSWVIQLRVKTLLLLSYQNLFFFSSSPQPQDSGFVLSTLSILSIWLQQDLPLPSLYLFTLHVLLSLDHPGKMMFSRFPDFLPEDFPLLQIYLQPRPQNWVQLPELHTKNDAVPVWLLQGYHTHRMRWAFSSKTEEAEKLRVTGRRDSRQ